MGKDGSWIIFSVRGGEVLICDSCEKKISAQDPVMPGGLHRVKVWFNPSCKAIRCEDCKMGKSIGPEDIWDLM